MILNEIKVSIIVPCFNVANYLPRCIESLINQSIKQIEIIIIDDGSTDESASIIERYVKLDNRIIFIQKNNGGVSSARNIGIKIARGNYIGFVDGDDYISPIMFEKMICQIQKNDAELACCRANSFNENGFKKYYEYQFPELSTKDEFVSQLFLYPKFIGQSVWNKLFIKEKITDLFDESCTMGEDALFLVNYCLNIHKVAFINEALYYVYERPNSAMRSHPDNLSKGIPVRLKLIDMVKTVSNNCYKLAQADFLDSCLYYLHLPELRKMMFLYIKNNIFQIVCNHKISIKLRLKYIALPFIYKREK